MTAVADRRSRGRAVLGTGARLLGVDAARALALVGMMATHLNPGSGTDTSPSVTILVASGRASALFAVLAGVGIALASGGVSPPRGRDWAGASVAIAARAAVVFVIGLVLGEFDSGLAVILSYYGLLFLVAIPVLRLRAGWLLGLGAAATVLTPIVSQWLRESYSAPLFLGVPTFETLVSDPGATLTNLLLTGYYPVLTWTSYLLIGMGAGRLALAERRVALRLVLVGAAVALVSWWASTWWLDAGGLATLQAAGTGGHAASALIDENLQHVSFYGTTPTTTWSWLGVASPHSGAPSDLFQTAGSAVAVLGIMLLLASVARPMIWPLAAVGGMTLTLYSLHVVLLSTILPRTTDGVLLLHVAVAFAIAVPWRRYVGRGPLEAVAAAAARGARAAVVRMSPRVSRL